MTKTNVHVVNLSNYVQPVIKEDQSKDWVTYGKKNEYWQYLIDRSNGSTTNSAAIQFMIKLIFGAGLSASNKALKPQEYAAMKGIFANKDVRRIADDFKRLGHAIIQVVYKNNHKTVHKASHFPVELIAPQKLLEGEEEIQGFYYPKNRDWKTVSDIGHLNFVPAFGTSKEGVEFLYIKTYSPGLFYFSVVDYSSALQWAETEEEIANYHINNIQNGFAPSMMINFNNGVPDPEQQRQIVNNTRKTLQGSTNTGTAIIAFNDNKENAGTIDPVNLSDASEQYQFVSTEAKQQILTGHRIPSPLLLGIPTGSGFSSTADELKTAFTLLEHQEAAYFRDILIDSFDKILAFNNISLDLIFESLNPFEAKPIEVISGEVSTTPQASEKELDAQAGLRGSVGGVQGILGIQSSVADGLTSFESAVNMLVEIYGFSREVAIKLLGEKTQEASLSLINEFNKVKLGSLEFDDKKMFEALDKFGEEEDLDNWEIVYEKEVNYEAEDLLDEQLQLVNTGTARPNAKSEQDGENAKGDVFKVRYQYNPLKTSDNSRQFCKMMVNAKKIYRKEDIIQMGSNSVNPGWGLNGADNYSIWKYKGGGACHHKWFRKVYKQREGAKNVDVRNPNAQTVSTTEARHQGFKPEANEQEVPVAPINMPNKGFVNK